MCPPIELLEASQISGLAELAQQTWLATFTDGLTESDIEEALRQRDSRYFEAVFDISIISGCLLSPRTSPALLSVSR